MTADPLVEEVVEALRAFLGDDRFRKLVGQVAKLAGCDRLHDWHHQVLDEFERSRALVLPRAQRR